MRTITITALSILLTSGYLRAQSISPEYNYAKNSPGTVMVQALFSATVYVNRLEMNEKVFDKLVDSVKRLDTTGTLFTPAQKLDMVVRVLYRSPFRFFSSTNSYFRQAHRVQSNGTGFLITPDGYVVTNCHIIERDSAYIRQKFIQSTFQEVTEANIDALQTSWAMTLTDQQKALLNDAYGLIYSQVSSMILFDLKKEFFVSYRMDGANGPEAVRKPAKLILKGLPMPGKDVAIMKIDQVDHLPVLTISTDTLPRIGAEVFVLGYPEPATSNSFISSEGSLEPSLTAGIVSAVKKSVGGWPVIQMDAMITHGSSGSPVCNDHGEVIGLATFGSIDQGSNSLASGFNFAIPVSVVNEFIRKAGLSPDAGPATIAFNKGLDAFYQQYFRRADGFFNEVKKLNPNYPQLSSYLQLCHKKIDGGADKQSPPRQYVFWVMVIIALMTSGYIFFKMKRQKLW